MGAPGGGWGRVETKEGAGLNSKVSLGRADQGSFRLSSINSSLSFYFRGGLKQTKKQNKPRKYPYAICRALCPTK